MRATIFSIVLLAFAALSTTDTNAQVTINDVELPATVQTLGSPKLVLNGGGFRKKLFFKVYVAGLYLTKKSSAAKAIVNADEAMAVRLVITSGMVNSDNMSEAVNEGFEKATGGNTAPIKEQIDQFIETFKSGIEEGDVYDIVYVPGAGVSVSKNGELKTTVKGLPFKKALFGIWLSDDPISGDLKEGMLGE